MARNSQGRGKLEIATLHRVQDLIEDALDRDQAIIFETEMLEEALDGLNQTAEHLGKIRDKALQNAESLREAWESLPLPKRYLSSLAKAQ